MLVLKSVCLLAVIITANGQFGTNILKRIERQQSPMTMGMKMLGDLRNGMQRTFDGIMNRVRPRPNYIRQSPQNRPPHNHQASPVSSHHSRIPSGHVMNRPQIPSNFVTKEEFPPAPIFKAATKSSFSVFHDEDPHTPSPSGSDHFNSDHFRNPSPLYHNPADNEIHQGNPQSNFMLHGSQAHQFNQNLDHGSHRNDFMLEDRNSHFKGSPSADQYTKSTDGWKVMHSPPTPRTTYKQRREQDPQSNEIYGNDYRNIGNHEKFPGYNFPENTLVVTHSPDIDSTHYVENHSNLPVVTLKSYASNTHHSNQNIGPMRSRVPPQQQRLKNKRPQPQRQPPMMANRERPQKIHKRDNLPLRAKPQGPNRGNARLVSNGYKMEMGPKQDEKDATVNGYEFGYGVMDDNTGNSFYHAEKKEDGTTHGSYKVTLPDGRIQTVNYLANEDGFQPEISFEENSKLPEQEPEQE